MSRHKFLHWLENHTQLEIAKSVKKFKKYWTRWCLKFKDTDEMTIQCNIQCRNIKLPNIITEGFETRIFGKDNLLFEKGQTVTFEFEFTFQYNYISANNHNLDNRNEISGFAPYFVLILNFDLPHDFAGKISKLICKLLMAWKKLSEEST